MNAGSPIDLEVAETTNDWKGKEGAMFRFHVDPCVFLLLRGLRYVVDEAAMCDALTNEDEFMVCVNALVDLLSLLGQAIRDCYVA